MECRTLHARIEPLGLEGMLALPPQPAGVVLFAHGSGSSRLSPRNRHVAETLQQAGLATLLFDLLRAEEAGDRRLIFDIPRLTTRLREAVAWVEACEAARDLPLGFFGSSTGAAAALLAAAEPSSGIAAVVSRGGRVDLAGEALARVRAPTLLIVGALDEEVLELNRVALAMLACPARLAIVPGASHLFEEPGTLEQVAAMAAAWFRTQFGQAPSPEIHHVC
ncbi:alpha/beta family hydrolase [Geminicoccaceae bacterium 1502E]|nr:alpha/beta family hydrolase [Geminicoccaceae bacterium 1502E]